MVNVRIDDGRTVDEIIISPTLSREFG